MKLSIVIATLNRLPMLRACLDSIPASCGEIEHEIIVVDGGSTDGTTAYLLSIPVIFVEQGKALGAVAAFNAGFALADGEYVAALNDDCRVVGETLRLACEYLDAHSDVGQVAIPYSTEIERPHTQEMTIGWKRYKRLYANFGVTRRVLGDRCGWWGDYLTHYGGDCELSANIWLLGYRVAELPGGRIIHHEANDTTRRENDRGGCELFKSKWKQKDVKRMPV